MDTIDLIGLLIPVTYLLMLAVEKMAPARAFPPRKAWAWMGIGWLLLLGVISTVVPGLFDPKWLEAHRLWDGTKLGITGGVVLGWVVLSGVTYAYHRFTHSWSPLWRLTHQIHHSPQRVDISGSLIFHPVEMVIQVLTQLFVTLIVLGLDPLAAALVGYVQAFYGLFQHWNVHTPAWIGWLIQRPESHCEHHRRGVHSGNFGDLPLWDIALGTWRNPQHFEGTCGFDEPGDQRVGAMLAFQDVNEPVLGSGSRGAARA